MDKYIDKIIHGDYLEVMAGMHDESVDLVLADPPYGTTQCSWDSVIPLEPMWERLKRIIKPNGAIVLFGTEPFSSVLRMSNIKNYKYDWVWEKTLATGYLNAKKMPMKANELVSVFYKKQPTYNPQKTTGHVRKISTSEHKRNCIKTEVYGEHKFTGYDSTERYPRTVVKFKTDKHKCALHPTQKPVALMEYLIRTYTKKGEVVLDFCIGSGTTAIACIKTGRHYVGIEQSQEYCKLAEGRIKAELSQPDLFK